MVTCIHFLLFIVNIIDSFSQFPTISNQQMAQLSAQNWNTMFNLVDGSILRLTWQYIPDTLVTGITNVLSQFRQGLLNIDQMEEYGLVVLRSHPPNVTPLPIIIHNEEYKRIEDYLRIKFILINVELN
jgi:hypothetical protein